MPQVPPPKRHPYDQWSPDARALDLVGDKWTLLIVRDLSSGPRRFVELQRVLPGISTEQLRSRLNRMVADGMLTRKRYREVPPRVDYELTQRARDLMPVLAELAKWGYQWAWTPPRTHERIDIGAILRLAPGMVAIDRPGEVELTVTDGHREGGPATFTIAADGSTATIVEQPSEQPAATITGTTEGWVKAFSAEPELGELTIEGDAAIAQAILGALSTPGEFGDAEQRRAVA